MMKKRVKHITVKLARKQATRKTWEHTLRTFIEAFCGILAGGIGDLFAREYGTPAFRLGLFSLITLAVSTAVTAVLNEDERINRSVKTFIQVFVGVLAGGAATVFGDYGTPAFRAALFSLLTVAVSTALGTAMNLQTPIGGGEVVPGVQEEEGR